MPSPKNIHAKAIRLRIMHGDDIAFGPGKAALLRAISQTGSISAAARDMGMSYRRAWLLVEQMNTCFQQPLVITTAGGANGGGAQVTVLAHIFLTRYDDMMRKAEMVVTEDMAFFASMMIALEKE